MDLMIMSNSMDSLVIQCLWCSSGRAGFGGSVRLSMSGFRCLSGLGGSGVSKALVV